MVRTVARQEIIGTVKATGEEGSDCSAYPYAWLKMSMCVWNKREMQERKKMQYILPKK